MNVVTAVATRRQINVGIEAIGTVQHIAISVLTNQSRADPNPVLASLLKLAFQPQPDCLTCADAP